MTPLASNITLFGLLLADLVCAGLSLPKGSWIGVCIRACSGEVWKLTAPMRDLRCEDLGVMLVSISDFTGVLKSSLSLGEMMAFRDRSSRGVATDKVDGL